MSYLRHDGSVWPPGNCNPSLRRKKTKSYKGRMQLTFGLGSICVLGPLGYQRSRDTYTRYSIPSCANGREGLLTAAFHLPLRSCSVDESKSWNAPAVLLNGSREQQPNIMLRKRDELPSGTIYKTSFAAKACPPIPRYYPCSCRSPSLQIGSGFFFSRRDPH